MAHIDRRDRNGTIRYVARYIDPTGQERSRRFTRRADAQKYLTEIEAAKLKGAWVDPAHGRTRFGDWHAEWWGTTVNLRPKTRTRNEMVFRLYVLPRFGAVPLDAISQREVRAWVTSLTVKGLAPATVHKAYQLFARTMAAAVDGGMLAQTPCRGVALPKVEHEEMRYLNPVEIACLADAIRPGYQALVFVGAYGGLRIGELAGLRRSRVDLDAGTVDVAETVVEVEGRLLFGPPKTRAGRRRIGLPRRVVGELALHLRAPGRPTDPVFRSPAGGPLRVTAFRNRIWRPATMAAGLPGLRIHDLRHTAVALWIAAGASPKEVAVRAGHTSTSFVLDRYGHLFPESDAALRDRLDELFEPVTGSYGNGSGKSLPTRPEALQGLRDEQWGSTGGHRSAPSPPGSAPSPRRRQQLDPPGHDLLGRDCGASNEACQEQRRPHLAGLEIDERTGDRAGGEGGNAALEAGENRIEAGALPRTICAHACLLKVRSKSSVRTRKEVRTRRLELRPVPEETANPRRRGQSAVTGKPGQNV